MGTHVLYTLEITFWKAVIPLMRESSFVQSCIRSLMPLLQHAVLENVIFDRKEFLLLLRQALLLAGIGFVLGFLIGLVAFAG